MRFEFATATRIVFGPGAARDLPSIASAFGRRALFVTGKDRIRRAGMVADLEAAGFGCAIFGVPGEPTVEMVREGAQMARDARATVVIAAGGGSAIDAGKAIAALTTNPGDVLNYLEVIGEGKPLEEVPLPFIAVPATAGTGSEVTRNAVLGSPRHGVKASLRSPMMLPKVALVDPELTFGLPPALTATTGLDALTQLIEPYVCTRANPLTDQFCREGLRLAAKNLPLAFENGSDPVARAAMSYASLLGGLALANAGLGLVHGFAAPVGGQFDAPHGAVCAALLPHGMAANVRALQERMPESGALARYSEIAEILTGRPGATPEEGVAWIASLVKRLKIPSLSGYGITQIDVPDLAEKASRASSMKANPITLSSAELSPVLTAAL
jgi:alcohol dehydrogenase class IV